MGMNFYLFIFYLFLFIRLQVTIYYHDILNPQWWIIAQLLLRSGANQAIYRFQ